MNGLQLPLIITFANQKGGVGKTTLCIGFANYLSSKGMKVSVIDCDTQQSITRRRQRDSESNPDAYIPYRIAGYRQMTRSIMYELIKDTYKNHSDEIILFDCPGNMTEEWILPLLGNSDIVIIPYHYDNITIASTSEFILFVDKINKSTTRSADIKVFLIPNLYDKRVGTKEERERWNKVSDKYSGYGTVTPQIEIRASMQRLSTVNLSETPFDILSETFDKVYNYITTN